ncbi:virion core protein [Turkeypox virus]|uniref:Assembly protein G7 n=1 Tax=Turkeypox virus TaxID=336486 RepID=A0A0M3ZHW1_9POXV|nr:virion core protein [Turkeypox virus]ALA62462.1 virion core protein [Turkeypox virus]
MYLLNVITCRPTLTYSMVNGGTKQSRLFNLVSKCLVETLLTDLINEKDILIIAGKAKYMYNPSHRDAIMTSIHQKYENELSLPTIKSVKNLLDRTSTYARHIHDETEFNLLRNIITRLTHNSSVFIVYTPLIISAASALLTQILSNQLIHAAKIIYEIETFLFDSKKTPIKEVSDLLDMKYAILNFAQYKIFPIISGYEIETTAGGKVMTLSDELKVIIDLPLKSPKLDEMYKRMAEDGMFLDSYAEYIAGLKIQDITDKMSTEKLSTYIANNSKILDMAYNYSKGHELDGAVVSPLSEDRIRLTSNDLKKFAILDYLYTIRVLANCVKEKGLKSSKKSGGTTLTITSPFKIITVPGK